MAATPPPPMTPLQNMLQTTVQSVQWTYSLFWQFCPQQGILIWGDGYYNGAIKTRKTVQPMEVSAEEASLQRSQQLRELYDSLAASETDQPARRPCASLSPEDLTESEWFYLMCVSFSFGPNVGLPGKAYARRRHVWLTGANEVDSKVFTRAILAKSARVQTVVCIPLMDGVVEFGTTERVQEDSGFVQHLKTFFSGHHNPQHHQNPPPPKPALSEQSTSNPATSSDHPARFHSAQLPPIYMEGDHPSRPNANQHVVPEEDEEEDDEEDEEEEDDVAEESDSESETARNFRSPPIIGQTVPNNQQNIMTSNNINTTADASELMQLEMSEDIRIGSPDDASNNLESDFHMLVVAGQSGNPQHRADSSYRYDTYPVSNNNNNIARQQPPTTNSGPPHLDELSQEDTHYSQTVSTILQNQRPRWSSEPGSGYTTVWTSQSAFGKWTSRGDHHLQYPVEGTTSQWLLKYLLFSVPYLHSKYNDESWPKSSSRDTVDVIDKFRKGTPQEELSANHVLAERRRREKLNERFIILRSLVPFVTKMDKASILGDTIEYVKQLRKKIQDLEARTRQLEVEQRLTTSCSEPNRTLTTSGGGGGIKETRSSVLSGPSTDLARIGQSSSAKRKIRVVEGCSGAKPTKLLVAESAVVESNIVQVQVSIIENDALVELQCPYAEGLLLDVMLTLRELRVEVTAVQSSLSNGAFVAEMRAKVKEKDSRKKATIAEVKRAIHEIIPK